MRPVRILPMSSSEECKQYGIIDCAGLHFIAVTTSNTVKSLGLELLSKGCIQVPMDVWDEFKTMYNSESKALKPYVKSKIKRDIKYEIIAGKYAKSGRSPLSMSPYTNSDYLACGVSESKSYPILTDPSRLSRYSSCGFAAAIGIEGAVLQKF